MEQVSDALVMPSDTDLPTPEARRRRANPLWWGTLAIAAALVAMLVAAVLRPATNNPLVSIGRPAPDFTMSLYGGGRSTLQRCVARRW